MPLSSWPPVTCYLPLLVSALLLVGCGADDVSDMSAEGSRQRQNTSDTAAMSDALSGHDVGPSSDASSLIGTDLGDNSMGDMVAGDADAEGAEALQTYQGLEEGYLMGGVMGTYHDGALDGPEGEPGEVFYRRLETDLSLTKNEDAYGGLNDGDLFSAHYEGAIHVEEPGVYLLMVTFENSVRLTLHGDTLIEMWDAKDLMTAQTKIFLEAGWHPLDIVYARDLYRAHLQLWLSPEGEDVAIVGPDRLGYSDQPPAEPENPSLEAMLVGNSHYLATFALESDMPCRIGVEVNGDMVDGVEEGDDGGGFETLHTQVVVTPPGGAYEVVFHGVDPWEREFSTEPITVVSPAIPEYTLGGLMGTYHSGTGFETPVGLRLDPRLHLPDDADGNTGGCFQSAMPDDNFSVRWEGGLHVDVEDSYTLYLGTDDGQRLYVDGELVAANWTGHGVSYVEATLYLAVGWHPLTIELYEGGGAAGIHFEWESQEITRQLVGPENLGYLPFDEPAEPPSILSFEPEVSGEGATAKVIWTSSKLSTAKLTIQMAEMEDAVIDFEAMATGFSYQLTEIPVGGATLSLVLTDGEGQSSSSQQLVLEGPPQNPMP